MNFQKKFSILLIGLVFVFGCGPKVMVPPDVDLTGFDTVGFIAFTSETEGNFDEYLNERFLEEISFSQRGVHFLELGTAEEVLQEIEHRKLDRDAIQEIGRKFNVDAVITGRLDISEIKPRVRVFNILSDLNVHADVDARITAKLFDTEHGSIVWTASARDRKTVANLSVAAGRPFFLNARNPEEAYGDLVDSIIFKVTRDLRVRYVRR